MFVDKICPTHPFDLWRSGQVNRGFSALLGADCQHLNGTDELRFDPCIVVPKPRGHKPRMQGIDCDVGVFEPVGQFVRKHHIGEFRLTVGPPAVVGALTLKIVQVDAAAPVGTGGHVDNAARRAALQHVEQ